MMFLSLVLHSQEKSFRSYDGTTIVFDDEGKGETILLLHGFINTRKSWGKAALKQKLLAKGYRVVIPDLRGNGDSDKPHAEQAWNSGNEVKDLIALMNHLSIERYVAIGYSRGSIVLAELLTLDQRISKAVFGGMGTDFTDSNWEIPGQFARAFNGEEELSEMTRGAVEYAKSINADLKSLSLQQRFQPSTTVQELNKIEIPILVICGDLDNSNDKAGRLATLFNNGKSVVVAGEHNHTYKQENFAVEVLGFIEE